MAERVDEASSGSSMVFVMFEAASTSSNSLYHHRNRTRENLISRSFLPKGQMEMLSVGKCK